MAKNYGKAPKLILNRKSLRGGVSKVMMTRTLTSIILAFFGEIETSNATQPEYDLNDIPPIEEICRNNKYSHEMESCLKKYMGNAESIINFLSKKLIAIWNESQNENKKYTEKYGNIISEFNENHELSEKYVHSNCNRKLYSYWYPGSVRVSKVLRCHYILKRERAILINSIYTVLPILK